MKNFDEYRLELEEYANNFDNKGQDQFHTINMGVDCECYKNMMTLMGQVLINENSLYEKMGDDELKKYEKWLKDGEF